MNTFTKTLVATVAAAAVSMTAVSAQAAIFIGVSTDGGTTIGTVFSSGDGTFSWAGAAGGFETITVDGDAGPLPALLHSDTVGVNTSGAASVTIFVTRTDLTSPTYHSFFSGFTGNTKFGGDFDVTLATLFDSANGQYGGAVVATTSYSGFGADADNFFSGPYDLSGTYSVTHRYDISTASGGSTSPTITLGAIPEPGTWALMIMGFGGAGAMLRSRRKALVAA